MDPAQAKALLTRMADHLAKAQSLSVTMDAGYDVVQELGAEDRVRRGSPHRSEPP